MTVSAPNEPHQSVSERRFAARDMLLITIGILLLLGALFSYGFLTTRDTQSPSVKGITFRTEIVSGKEAMAQGLSGREGIDSDAAMVFEFGRTGQHCMWMKDMKFNIDILWLDESNKIVAMERNVTPESYPKAYCHDSYEVVELASGTIDHLPLYVGDHFSW